MNLIEQFFAKRKFPKVVHNEWFAYQGIRKLEGKDQLPEYFSSKTGKYVKYKINDVVPLRIKDGYKAFYRITGKLKPYGDYASWDDGVKYSLVLHHVERVKL